MLDTSIKRAEPRAAEASFSAEEIASLRKQMESLGFNHTDGNEGMAVFQHSSDHMVVTILKIGDRIRIKFFKAGIPFPLRAQYDVSRIDEIEKEVFFLFRRVPKMERATEQLQSGEIRRSLQGLGFFDGYYSADEAHLDFASQGPTRVHKITIMYDPKLDRFVFKIHTRDTVDTFVTREITAAICRDAIENYRRRHR